MLGLYWGPHTLGNYSTECLSCLWVVEARQGTIKCIFDMIATSNDTRFGALEGLGDSGPEP